MDNKVDQVIVEESNETLDSELLLAADELIKSELAAQEADVLEKAKGVKIALGADAVKPPKTLKEQEEDEAKAEEIEKAKKEKIIPPYIAEAIEESKEDKKEEAKEEPKAEEKHEAKESPKEEAKEDKKEEEKKPSDMDEIKAVMKAMSERLQSLEKAMEPKEEIKKSVEDTDVVEILTKSYSSKIQSQEKVMDEMKKSYTSQIEELKKGQEELVKSLQKPARRRETVSNFDVIQKGTSEEPTGRLYKSKNEVLEALEDLRKSGKISGDEVIAYNVSNILSSNARKQLLKG